jgi:CBS domain-containing protein
MTTVRHILDGKGREVWSIPMGATVYDALTLMAEKNVGALMVLEDGSLRGIISERDYARKVILKGKSSKELQVSEIMTPDPFVISPDQSIEECMALMTMHRIRHLPVEEEGRLMGIISIGDVVKSIISEQEFTIRQLENYITGSSR